MQTSAKTSRQLQNLHIHFDEIDLHAITRAFNSTSFSGRSPIIADYEAVISAYFGSPHALACSNGTVAIELALRSLELKPGAAVAVPPTAPVMTILPVISLGLRPVFYDVRPDSFAPDLDDLRSLSAEGIAALITVPMWGYPWDMEAVAGFCSSNGIALIEDCAHAFGTEMNGRKFGTFGDIATYSTHERKLVSTGEGGFCLTPHVHLHERMRTWQHHGALFDASGAYRVGERIGSNSKLAPLCAALGISQFARLDIKIASRRAVVARLREALKPCKTLVEFNRYPGSEINGYAMVFWFEGEDRGRSQLLAASGIQSDTVRYNYKPLYHAPAFARYARPCPNAEKLIGSIITLPCHEGLSGNDICEIAAVVEDIYGRDYRRSVAS